VTLSSSLWIHFFQTFFLRCLRFFRQVDGFSNRVELGNGALSYQFKIPHSALASGLTSSPNTVALSAEDVTFENVEITVDGHPARIVNPAETSIAVRQATRAFTHRIDLEVGLPMSDSDNDGLPDWWEEKYGLDPQLANASGDLDGDGLTNLQEYRAGSDPTRDNSKPTLLTTEFVAYADGTTAVPLETLDTDSAPEQLVYTLNEVPSFGELFLRNATEDSSNPDQLLEAGARFTQADIRNGRLIFAHYGSSDDLIGFEVSVRDEDPDHEPAAGAIKVTPYRPAADVMTAIADDDLAAIATSWLIPGVPDAETLRVRCYVLSRESNYVIWEAPDENRDARFAAPSGGLSSLDYHQEYVASHGADRGHVIVAGAGADKLSGGMEADILVGGPGDDELAGGGGTDQFVYMDVESGSDSIADFGIGDAIDLSRILQGTSKVLTDYVQADASGEYLTLRIDADGDGSGFTNTTIKLTGVPGDAFDLYALVENGQLRTGGLELVPRITITASKPLADENELAPGEFLLTRQGASKDSLEVSLSVSGSAQNGVDFSMINSKITFPAGQATVAVPVLPFADNQAEPQESVELILISGEGYIIGEENRASLKIDDLQMIISIEVLEPLAVRDPLSPAAFLIRREGILDRAAVVLLEIGGTASNGTDYQRLSRFVNLSLGQSTAVIEVTPRPDASLDNGGETVVISVSPDAAYRMREGSSARITLIEREATFAMWRSEIDPEFEGNLSEFGLNDPGRFGVPNLHRYAYGMDSGVLDRSRLPKLILREGYLTVDVSRRADATDVAIIVEASTDMQTWNASPANVGKLVLPEHRNRPDITSFRALTPIDQQQTQYLRVRVVRIP